MFDVSFSELMVVAVVALIVIGPEKLPKVARMAGAFAGRMQRYVAQVKEEINREVRFEELQKLQEEIKQSVEKQSSIVQSSFNETFKSIESENDLLQADTLHKPLVKKTTKKFPDPSQTKKGVDIKSAVNIKNVLDINKASELDGVAGIDQVKNTPDIISAQDKKSTENSAKTLQDEV